MNLVLGNSHTVGRKGLSVVSPASHRDSSHMLLLKMHMVLNYPLNSATF